MEGTEQAVTQNGFLDSGIPSWLVFMLVGVFAALILIGAFKRRGVPFFGIIIVVIIVALIFSNGGNLNFKDWWTKWSDSFFFQKGPADEEPIETPEETEPSEDNESDMATSESTWIEIAIKDIFNQD